MTVVEEKREEYLIVSICYRLGLVRMVQNCTVKTHQTHRGCNCCRFGRVSCVVLIIFLGFNLVSNVGGFISILVYWWCLGLNWSYKLLGGWCWETHGLFKSMKDWIRNRLKQQGQNPEKKNSYTESVVPDKSHEPFK